MPDYVTVEQFKSRFGISSSDKDVRLAEHVTAASRKADGYCRRSFAPHVGVATVRYFHPMDRHSVWIDDAYDITEVAVDDDDTYATVWTTADYEPSPANGVGPDGQAGWPTMSLHRIGEEYFSMCYRRPVVRVTAKWGWPAVPADVTEAVYLFAARLSYEVGVPGGVTPPNLDFGLPGSPLQREYTAERLLGPYVRDDITAQVV